MQVAILTLTCLTFATGMVCFLIIAKRFAALRRTILSMPEEVTEVLQEVTGLHRETMTMMRQEFEWVRNELREMDRRAQERHEELLAAFGDPGSVIDTLDRRIIKARPVAPRPVLALSGRALRPTRPAAGRQVGCPDPLHARRLLGFTVDGATRPHRKNAAADKDSAASKHQAAARSARSRPCRSTHRRKKK